MAEADIRKFVDNPLFNRLASFTFLSAAGSNFDDSQEQLGDARVAIDVLAFVAALVVEGDPDARTAKDIKARAEDFGERIRAYARAIREASEREGHPFIMHFGGTGNSVPMPDDEGRTH